MTTRSVITDTAIVRKSSTYLDGLLGHQFPVLDHGFIRVIDYMGDDSSILEMAKMSYDGGTQVTPDERTLLRYLFRHKHTSPTEGCEIKLHLKMPIFIARQWIRHRMASLNEFSGRYSVMPDEFFVPMPEDIKKQSSSNKQGRGDDLDPQMQQELRNIIDGSSEFSFMSYNSLLENEVAKETSRIILPLNTYTQFYWKIDLHNLLHFLELRMHPHAQKEIRDYADLIYEFLWGWVPNTAEALKDYRLDAMHLSRMEVELMQNMFAKLMGESSADPFSELDGMIEDCTTLSKREKKEFIEKMQRFSNG